MVAIKRIVCPIDFSDFSQHALEHAAGVARWYESQVTVLHVIPIQPPPVSQSEFDGYQLTPQAPPIELGPIAAAVQRFCAPVIQGGRAETVVRVGNPLDEIVGEVGARAADLLVMGTHGRSGFDRLFLGSVAERVIRKVSCPVMTVPPRNRHLAGGPIVYKTILCPIDFSPPSVRALEFALTLAKEAGGRLILMHAIEVQTDEMMFGEKTHYTVPEYFRYLREDAQKQLDSMVPDEARAWCTPECRLPSGTPYRQILATADETDADLIVMGVAGRAGFSTMLLGSTTNQVLRGATCPVLTVRS